MASLILAIASWILDRFHAADNAAENAADIMPQA